MERMVGWVAGVALGSAAILFCAPAAPPASVVLITIDTLRADHLGCYGYFRHTSPFIDQLAADGLLFERAITPMSTTLPAHTSLMTSAYPARHGVLSNLNFYHQPVVTDKGFQTAAQMFREAGYLTAGFVSSPGLGEESGITAGFQVFDESGIRDAFTTTSRVIDWLDSVPARPFFLWVHYFDPHHPYDPPPDYRDYRSDERQLQFVTKAGIPPKHRTLAMRYSNLYDGEIRYTDDHVGWLLSRLRELDLYRTSMIVLTSDHGEGLMEHGVREHGVIYNEQLFVPLIFKFPEGRGPVGERSMELASLIDVLPTMVESLALPIPTEQFDGVSLLSKRREFALSERDHTRRRFGSEVNLAVISEHWKYFLYTEGADQLYDLERDFEELENVIDEHPEVAERLRKEILGIWKASRERGSGLRIKRDVSPQLVEALRGLGYVE